MQPRDQLVDDFSPLIGGMVRKSLTYSQCSLIDIENEYQKVVFDAIQRWDGTQSNPVSWIFTVLRGRMKDLAKTSVKKPSFESLDLMEKILERASCNNN